MAEKTKAELEAENAELRAQVDELLAASPSPRIALVSRTGQPRNRGGYTIHAVDPIVLDVADIKPADLAELLGDPHILKVRSDSPLTPKDQVVTYERA